jgi:DNA-directed RNA polymerase omega subunit
VPNRSSAAPEAVLIFVLPPSREEQERRLRGRGDPGDKVLARLKKAESEEPIGRALADHLVVNDDLDRTIDEMMSIIETERARLALPRGTRRVAVAAPTPTRSSTTMELSHDTMMNPPIEDLLARVDSKFSLVTLAARRARNINSYFTQLGDGSRAHDSAPGVVGVAQAAEHRVRGDRRRQDRLGGAGRGAVGARRRSRRHRGLSPSPGCFDAAGTRIVLGVSGGIAAYKAVEVCRRLVDAGAHVVPVMTRAPSTSSGGRR